MRADDTGFEGRKDQKDQKDQKDEKDERVEKDKCDKKGLTGLRDLVRRTAAANNCDCATQIDRTVVILGP